MMRVTNFSALLLATTALFSVTRVQAQSLPSGAELVSGSAAVTQTSPSTTTITQSSQNAIINWQAFSIGQDQSVNILQPGASSALLNRVTGDTSSVISGQLTANGRVFLVNPNGISIGPTGRVNAAGFVASSLDISNDDFRAGRLNFKSTGPAGTVSNSGVITVASGGYAALLGASVSNDGTIIAPMGKVAVGAGDWATLDLSGDSFLQVALRATDGTAPGLVAMSSGEARDLVRQTVNMSDVAEATTVSGTNGNVILGGTIDTSSAEGRGGDVSVMGQTVTVADATIKASGATGGGLVETSGEKVDFTGIKVDTRAANGSSGTWLIDPIDLTVDASSAQTISTNLATSNVTLKTTSITASGPGVQTAGVGDININSAITWSSSRKLTLDAYHGININAAVTATGAGTVALLTNDGGSGGDYGFGLSASGFAGSLSFTGTANSGQALTINGDNYTLLYSLSDFAALSSGFYALAKPVASSATYSGSIVGSGYTGTFTGLGNSISGLAIDDTVGTSQYAGLFAASFGTIRDVGLSSGSVHMDANAANMDTSIGALIGRNRGTVKNVFSSAQVIGNRYVNGSVHLGGLVGWNDPAGSISNVYVEGPVILTDIGSLTAGYGQQIGGLVGINDGAINGAHVTSAVAGNSLYGFSTGGLAGVNTGTIASSDAGGYVQTYVSQSGYSATMGGLVGESFSGSLTDVFATGAVHGDGGWAGGLVGYNSSTITNAYAMGSVRSTYSGGIVGGLIGYNSNATVSSVFATGYVSSTGVSGVAHGLVGGTNLSTLTSGYYDYQTSGQASGVQGDGSTGVSTASLQGSLPSGFSSSSWGTGTGLYPYLTSIFANGVQSISGNAYLANGSNAVANNVGLYANGSWVGGWLNRKYVSTGANGYYYYLAPSATIGAATGVIAGLHDGNSYIGARYTDQTVTNGNLSGFDIKAGLVKIETTATNDTQLQTGFGNAAGVSGSQYNALQTGLASYGVDTDLTATGGYSGSTDPWLNNSSLRGTYSSGSLSVKTLGGDATLTGINTPTGKGVVVDSYGSISLSGAVNSAAVVLTSNDGGTGGTISFPNALTFNGTSGNALTENGHSYNLLYSRSDMLAMSLSGYNALANDISFSGTTYTNSLFTGSLTGVFEGLGHTASSLTINAPSQLSVGMFSNVGANGVVQNFNLGASVTAGSYSGGLAGLNSGTISAASTSGTFSSGAGTIYVGGLVGENFGTITNGSKSSSTVNGNYGAGGLVGVNFGTINGASHASGTVTGSIWSGGFAGLNYGAINGGSYATGAVIGDFGAGGFVGTNVGTLDSVSASNGAVTGTTNVGGLAGYVASGGTISNSSTGGATVTGTSSAIGGLAGVNVGTITASTSADTVRGNAGTIYTGGLVGMNYATIGGSSASTGSVTGDYGVGGLVGINFATVNGTSHASGPVAGYIWTGGLAGLNYGTINGGVYATGAVTGNFGAGGFVGTNAGTLDGVSASNGAVTGATNVGGLAGYVTSGATINNSTTSGAIVTGTSSAIGGLAGVNVGTITASTSADTVEATAGTIYTGGLVGMNYASIGGSSASTGSVTGDYGVGGLVGINFATVNGTSHASGAVTGSIWTGGLAGLNYGTINDGVYATGAVTGNFGAGGFVGTNAGTLDGVSASNGAVTGATNVGGLAGYVTSGATINNSTTSGATVTGTSSAIGGLAGVNVGTITASTSADTVKGNTGTTYTGGLVGMNYAAIGGSSASTGSVTGDYGVGGLVGINFATVNGTSSASSSVTAKTWVGGLAGLNYGTINGGAYESGGSISGTTGVGGLVGFNTSVIDTVTVSPLVINGNSQVGGVVGYNATAGTITAATASGQISATIAIGGVAGINFGTISSSSASNTIIGSTRSGGLVGENYGTVQDSYSTGSASGTDFVGGFVGYNAGTVKTSWSAGFVPAGTLGGFAGYNSGNITNAYWDVGLSGHTNSTQINVGTQTNLTGIGGTTGKNPFDKATYTGFDFTHVWQINQGTGRPFISLR